MDKSKISSIYSLSPMQEGILYHKLLDESEGMYCIQNIIELDGKLDINCVQDSLWLLAEKYQVLRTAITMPKKSNKPWQVILNNRNIELISHDISMVDLENQDESIRNLAQADVHRGFNLEKDSLLRMTIIKTAGDRNVILWTTHHIIMDGWCTSLLFRDFMVYYAMRNKGVTLDKLKEIVNEEKLNIASYQQYIKWLEKQDKEKALGYWRNLLEGYETSVEIKPVTLAKKTDTSVASVYRKLSRNLTKKLADIATENTTTLSTILEMAWGILLQKYCYSKDVVFGKVVSGRNADIRGIEQAVGLFINTIAVRVKNDEGLTLKKLLSDVGNQAIESSEFEYCSLAEIQKETTIGSALINSLFVFENYYVDKSGIEKGMDGLDFSVKVKENREETNYPLNFIVELEETLNLQIMYDPSIYEEQEISVILKRIELILESIAKDLSQRIEDINILEEEEKILVTETFNDTKTNYPFDKTVVEVFEEQVRKYPNNIAVTYRDETITYNELNIKSNQLAYKLIEMGVKREDFVALLSEKSIEMIVGIIAIIKAGGAYLPIHTDYPADRIEFIVKDSMPKVVLKGNVEISFKAEVPVMDIANERFYGYSSDNPKLINKPNDLIYNIYTSGTTGQPKGTLIEHRNVLRLVKDTNYISLNDKTVILQTGAISFDASTFEVWGALLNGGKLCLVDNDIIIDSKAFKETIYNLKANTLWLTSALFNQIVLSDLSVFDTVEYLLIGGEKLSDSHVSMFKSYNKKTKLINGYGPTENTTFTTTYEIPEEFDLIPIGKPIANTQIYILNGDCLCGVGMPGELCVAGDGVGRGYLNQEELTKVKFIDNPFGEGKLYRTGDFARWLADGNIEYLGRIDNQVKIRGFRIELGEIEKIIQSVAMIKDATVILSEDNGEKELCAYVVADTDVDLNALKSILQEQMPDYMIPNYIMQISSIPTNVNGKVDKRKLPKIEKKAAVEYIAPRNETETLITKVFEGVLGVDKVSVKDNFFELGGHSLKATRLINQIEAAVGVRISLKDVFIKPTVEELSELVLNTNKSNYTPIPLSEEKDYYKMSSTQKRMYTLWEVDKLSIAYNMPVAMDITENFNIDKINLVFDQLISRHEILRTSFEVIGGEFVQRVHKNVQFEIAEIKTDKTLNQCFEDFVKPFNLNKAPLIGATIINSYNGKFLLFDMHHIISDGASMNILIEEFTKLYKEETLEPLKIQFKDYSEWTLKNDFIEHKEFWINLFKGEIPVLNLPLDKARAKTRTYEAETINYKFNEETKNKIKAICSQLQVTDYMFFLGCLMTLFGKLGRQEDVVIGSPISGRTHKDTEKLLGMFANTIALRGFPQGEKSFSNFMKEIKETCLKAFEYQDYPFEQLIEELNLNKDSSRNPLFDICFVLQNNEDKTHLINNLGVELLTNTIEKSKFDLNIEIVRNAKEYAINLTYATDLFEKVTIERMLEYFFVIVNQVVSIPNINIKSLEMLPEENKQVMLYEVNNGYVPFPEEKCVYHLFEEQVIRTPDKIAIYDGDEAITYTEFNSKVNQLARALRSRGIKPNDTVAIIAKRSTRLLMGIYAVLKAGAAYVPMDPSYPDERIKYMLSDCAAKLVLIDNENILEFEEFDRLNLKDDSNYIGDTSNLEVVNSTKDLAYIIYTSGTTGNPKGVMITHKTLTNYITWGSKQYFDESDMNMPLFTSVAFDLTVTTIYTPLVTGNSIVVYSEDYAIEEICMDPRIKIIKLTPSHLAMVRNTTTNCYSIKRFILGGEELHTELSDKIIELYGDDTIIYNEYGPTEATVGCMIYAYTIKDNTYKKTVSIGRPIDNVSLYVMNDKKLCGIGMIGELCIGGKCLAKGYLNQEKLTDDKFIDNPYIEGEKIYRTGDLVRWVSKDDMEYLGRIDEQVKIRGYRIELSEIENIIMKNPKVKNVVVVVQEGNGDKKFLCAYYVHVGEVGEDFSKLLLNEMKNSLPQYMIPEVVQSIESIPLTINGKVDKRALPKIDFSEIMKKNYVAPTDELEEKMVKIWEEILGIEPIGIEDDFFECGGDSIHAIRIISKVREIGYEFTIKELMEIRTISGIKVVMRETGENDLAKYQLAIDGEVNFSPIQKHFFAKKLIEPNYYNQAIMLEIEEDIKVDALEKILQILTNYHDVLRSVFNEEDKFYIKPIGESKNYELVTFDLKHIKAEAIEAEIASLCENLQSSMEINQGSLLKVAVIKTQWKDLLFMCIHHLIVDGVSWRILIEDIQTLYSKALDNQELEANLLPKTASYKLWTENLMEYKESYELKMETEYWTQTVARVKAIYEAANKKLVNENKGGEHQLVTFSLTEEESNNLLNNASFAFNTEVNDLMISALAIAVNRWDDSVMIPIEMESHGREMINNTPIDRTIGWFTSTYPVVIDIIGEDFRENIISTKETLHKVKNNGIGYGVLRYLNGIEQLSVDIEISFNYLGTVDNELNGDFKVSDYNFGKSISDKNKLWNPITIGGSTKNGITSFDIMWDEECYSYEEIQRLAYEYQKALVEVIDFCIGKDDVEYSSSDFGEDEWDDNDMKEVMGIYA